MEHASPLRIAAVQKEEGEHIVEGLIQCINPQCYREYPILDGVPMLVAGLRAYMEHSALGVLVRTDLSPELESILGDCVGPNSAYDVLRQHLSQYSRDHYGDLDPENTEEERREAGSVLRVLRAGMTHIKERPSGPILDLGCSVGRTTFELAETTGEWVLGADLNFSMLRVASQALRTGRVQYPRRRVGVVYDRRAFDVPFGGADRVDFWQVDAMALPFPEAPFSMMTSINLLDCLPIPVQHLQSLSTLVRPDGAVLMATPFDWSPAASAVEAWIGGHGQRNEVGGSSETWLERLLCGGGGLSGFGWQICGKEDVSWTVRIHSRNRVEYQTRLLVLKR